MKTLYAFRTRFFALIMTGSALLSAGMISAQPCTPLGDGTTYGTNNVWIGYAYQGKNFDTYKGYVTEGISSNPNFDESFGGDQVNYNTNGCSVYTEGFSMRYKLNQSFINGNYLFTVGGDDGYRLSLDGGSTWPINNWGDHGYTTSTYTIALNGPVNIVLEYYENGGGNRVSFNVTAICTGTGDPSIYGTNGVWQGYIYQGMNFDLYKGSVTEGIASNPNFDESFGSTGTYNTSSCSIQTQQFSARYRLKQTITQLTNVVITVGGDDGYRLSLDGGATWVINKWVDQSYGVTGYSTHLTAGTYDMVLEYYQNGGSNRVTFGMSNTLLPVTLINWSASAPSADQELLQWKCTDAVNFDHFEIQRSTDGRAFSNIHTEAGPGPGNVGASAGNGGTQSYSFTDQFAYNGMVWYRLAMVDLDGNTRYSNVITLSLRQSRVANIYPTVVQDGNIFVEFTQPVSQAKLEVFDMSGRKLSEKDFAVLNGRQQVSLAAGGRAGITSGLYVVRLSNNSEILAKTIVVVK
ncbi:MAG TPA: T9SS type A sorting domain-containing protein [Puia sp.]|nr:T9SS type A sorting domain-containing protein [Puia sp.]